MKYIHPLLLDERWGQIMRRYEVAAMLNITPDRVTRLSRSGKLRARGRTPGGFRVWFRPDVEAYMADRAAS